jgi:hypothetical protein
MKIDSALNGTNDLGSNPSGFIRSLGAVEEIYWLSSQTGPRGFAYAAEIEGHTTVDAWRKAIDQVQQSQPFFTVCIEPNPGGKPYFRQVAGASIPMRVLNGLSEHRWETEVAKQVFEPFSGDEVPLVRTVLIHDPDRSILIIAAHHSISDGISMTVVLRDLVRALSGEAIHRYPVLPSQEEAFGITGPSAPPSADSERAAAQPAGPPVVLGEGDAQPPVIESLRLDSDLTTRLVDRARAEGTTVHGAICSAVLQAGRDGSRTWNEEPVNVLSAISSRKACGVGDTSAMYSVGGLTSIEPGLQVGFWDLARRFTEELDDLRSREGLQMACQVLTDVAAQGLNPASAREFLTNVFGFDVIISNLGKLPFSTDYGTLRLKSIWGSSALTGAVDEQDVGVVTINGHLHLLYTTYTPIPSFLQNIRILLSEACDLLSEACDPAFALR